MTVFVQTGSMVEVMTARAKALQEQFMFERRLLFLCTGLVGIAVLLWVVSITTDFWFIVNGGPGIYVNHTGRYFLSSNSGLWRICR